MRTPSFDTWTIIFLFSAIQGIFVGVVFLLKKEKHVSRKILACLPILFSVILLEYVLYWTGYFFYYPYLAAVSTSIIFLFGPLLYLYFQSIFVASGLKRTALFHFVPFVISLLYFAPFMLKSVAEKQAYFTSKHHVAFDFPFYITRLGIVHMLVYAVLIHRHYYVLSLINVEIKKWFRWLTGFFWGFLLSYLSYYVLINFPFFNNSWDYAISFSMMFFIFFLSWFGYLQPKVFCGFNLFEPEDIKYKNSPISKDIGKEIVGKLEQAMSEKKYFLKSDLSLEKLAELIGTSKHYLSQAINENLEMNFFEYINHLRIHEAKALLQSNKELTVIEIAYQVGYNNKVSFNKAFKNIVGHVPTEFRNAL